MGGPTDDYSGVRTLAVWSEQLATEGAFLLVERTHAISELAELAARWFCELAGAPQHLHLEYRSSVLDAESVNQNIRPTLAGELEIDSSFPTGGGEPTL